MVGIQGCLAKGFRVSPAFFLSGATFLLQPVESLPLCLIVPIFYYTLLGWQDVSSVAADLIPRKTWLFFAVLSGLGQPTPPVHIPFWYV